MTRHFLTSQSHDHNAGWKNSPDTGNRYRKDQGNTYAHAQSPAFPGEDRTLRPPAGKTSHWSVAWSDLMMTMFILFLSLFVYQAAQRDLVQGKARETRGAIIEPENKLNRPNSETPPFLVLTPSAPPMSVGDIPRGEKITLEEVTPEATFSAVDVERSFEELANSIARSSSARKNTASSRHQAGTVMQPAPLGAETTASNTDLFDRSRHTVETNDLGDFAAIDLLPDKAVRIVLTGDLLFKTGEAVLSNRAIRSLEKIAAAIRTTPHQIHIEGHTDNVPIFSERYANNWELSVARANAVAAFLIEDMDMNPKQFVISGYASYKPVAPNSQPAGRAQNRRVEIVVTQPAQQPTVAGLDSNSQIPAL